eukprot:5115747-Amphidinium_carterae.1
MSYFALWWGTGRFQIHLFHSIADPECVMVELRSTESHLLFAPWLRAGAEPAGLLTVGFGRPSTLLEARGRCTLPYDHHPRPRERLRHMRST